MALHKDIIERANARLGSVLKGKWRLDAVIGIGGMASVYAATHRNQARAAIKLLHAEVAMDAEVTARFLREGYVANAVGHPGTVNVLDDDVSEDNAPYLVMELLVGQTLDTLLAMDPDGLAVQEVLGFTDQLLDVLAAAHDKGIVHRDLKPENLFLTSDGRLKVLDFGIARLRELSTPLSPTATQAGSVLGTPAFMAPEQALGRWHEVDGRTDIWSVGATAFTLLTGQFVHNAETLQEQLVLSATRPARQVRAVNPLVPEALAQVVDRALSFDRSQRFPNARAMRQAMGLAAAQSIAAFTPVSTPLRQSARVSTAADQHGATLVAPAEVTPAITGRGDTATGHPVTRSTVISGPRDRRQWPLLGALAGLCLLGGGTLWAFRQHGLGTLPTTSSAAWPTPAAPVTARAPESIATVAPPSVAPVLEPPHPSASVVAKRPAVGGKAAHATHSPAFLVVPGLPELPNRPPTRKSLTGDENPFDRRH